MQAARGASQQDPPGLMQQGRSQGAPQLVCMELLLLLPARPVQRLSLEASTLLGLGLLPMPGLYLATSQFRASYCEMCNCD